MAKQERPRKSAPQNVAKSFADANLVINPSYELDEAERKRFDAIIDSRERNSWVPADVETAANLAIIEVERDRTRKLYRQEGPKIIDDNGKQAINPTFKVYCDLDSQAHRTRRDLGLNASQRGISGHRQVKRNQQDAAAKSKLASVSSLIKKPDAQA